MHDLEERSSWNNFTDGHLKKRVIEKEKRNGGKVWKGGKEEIEKIKLFYSLNEGKVSEIRQIRFRIRFKKKNTWEKNEY